MAANPIATSLSALKASAKKVHSALVEHGQTIGILHNTPQKLMPELTDLTAAGRNYDSAKTELTKRISVLHSLTAVARQHAILARDNLRPHLGRKYSRTWDSTGYRGSLETPESADALQELLVDLKGFYTANPNRELAAADLTAAHTGNIADEMAAASSAILLQKDVVDGLLKTRNQMADRVRRRLRLVFHELEMLIDPMSSHWLAFGFNKPGAQQTPAKPNGLKVTLNGTNGVLSWENTPRAAYYHVWKRVIGADEEPVAIGTTSGLFFAINDLLPGATVEFSISAVNDGGESARGKLIRVMIE